MSYHTGLWTILVQRRDPDNKDRELTKINSFGTIKKPLTHKVPKEKITITTVQQFSDRPKLDVKFEETPQDYYIINHPNLCLIIVYLV